MELIGLFRELQLLVVEPADRTLAHCLFDHGLDQHVAQDALARRRQPALGPRIVGQVAFGRLARQQLLVDHLVKGLMEKRGRGVQRVALADQALGGRLALDVGGPDRLPVHRRHRAVAGLRRLVRRVLTAARRQSQQADKPRGDRARAISSLA